jgi:hypothetical protein
MAAFFNDGKEEGDHKVKYIKGVTQKVGNNVWGESKSV